jgi:hypothetical protein
LDKRHFHLSSIISLTRQGGKESEAPRPISKKFAEGFAGSRRGDRAVLPEGSVLRSNKQRFRIKRFFGFVLIGAWGTGEQIIMMTAACDIASCLVGGIANEIRISNYKTI